MVSFIIKWLKKVLFVFECLIIIVFIMGLLLDKGVLIERGFFVREFFVY